MPSPIYKEQLDRIEKALIGNGQKGLLDRTARLEERMNTTDTSMIESKKETENTISKVEKEIKDLTEIVNKLTQNVNKLESSLATHVGTDHLSVLMKKKQFWALIIIGFIALHIIATYVPNLWDWIAVLLGLPKLIAPLG